LDFYPLNRPETLGIPEFGYRVWVYGQGIKEKAVLQVFAGASQ
jgi:hypothetical protein